MIQTQVSVIVNLDAFCSTMLLFSENNKQKPQKHTKKVNKSDTSLLPYFS